MERNTTLTIAKAIGTLAEEKAKIHSDTQQSEWTYTIIGHNTVTYWTVTYWTYTIIATVSAF